MGIKSGWKHVITLSKDYAIYRSTTNKRLFGTGYSPNHTDVGDSPIGGETYSLNGRDLLTASSSWRSIARTKTGFYLGCTHINLKKLDAAGLKHRCKTLLISKKNRAKIAKLKIGASTYVNSLVS